MSDQQPSVVRALRPVESAPGVRVVPAADRRLAAEQWLLATLPAQKRDTARMEWQNHGVALLPLGTLFSAVRIPERLVHTVSRVDEPAMNAAFLQAALDDGPVICDPARRWYYALVPASMAHWHKAARIWRTVLGVEILGRDTLLGVPPVDKVSYSQRTNASYWACPIPSAADLCDPHAVTRLIAAAARQIGPRLDT